MKIPTILKIAKGNDYKYLLVKLFFKNYFFIFFSFANCFLPLAISFIIAYAKTTDAINFVIGTGLVSGFIVSFYQLGFTFSFAILNLLSTLKKGNSSFLKLNQQHIIAQQYIGSVLIGIVLIGLFCVLCFLYLKFAGDYPNTPMIAKYGDDFAFSSSPTILIVLLNSTTLFNIFYKVGNLRTTIIAFFQLIIDLFFISLIGLLTPHLHVYGFAIGLIVGSLVNLIISSTISYLLKIRMCFSLNKNTKQHVVKVFYNMLKISLINLYYTSLRVLVVIVMAASLQTYKHIAFYNFMIAKILYFLGLYVFSFFSNGTVYTLTYIKSTYKTHPNIFNASYSTNWIIVLVMGLCTTAIALGYYFGVPGLVEHFIMNVDPNDLIPPSASVHDITKYVGVWGPEGVMSFIGLPQNATLLLIVLAVIILSLTSAMMVDPIAKKKPKKKILSLLSQIWRPTFSLCFIVGFGFGMFNKGPFHYMESFAVAYTINASVLCLYQFVRWIIINKRFKNNYLKINFINIVIDKLVLANQNNYRKIVKNEMFPQIKQKPNSALISHIFKEF